MSYIQDKLDEFDKQFGKAGENKNCDSIGRWAGCDDCEENIELRDEHRKFIEQVLTDYHNHIVEKIEGMKLEIPEYRNKRGHHTNSAHMKIRHNKALQMVQSFLQDTNPKE